METGIPYLGLHPRCGWCKKACGKKNSLPSAIPTEDYFAIEDVDLKFELESIHAAGRKVGDCEITLSFHKMVPEVKRCSHIGGYFLI